VESYESRLKIIQELDLSVDEKRDLLDDLKFEIEMDEATETMKNKALLLNTINMLVKVL
jgi:hypothetical protein